DEHAGGQLISFDINPRAGWLVGEHPLWRMRVESTRQGLPGVLADSPPLGLFIHDSLHTYENERFELTVAAQCLTAGGLLISDNAHVTRALEDTCKDFGYTYSEFRERPLRHFYPGGTLGAGRRGAD
ncbi:MAG: class I SAM-dependent methyltransferase, partial [Candidatus Dormibacteraeota bacterium]|nr:class I SAM-dependent methyltransferase [Candidatus Dormibacteraeota bacterium]